MAAITLPVNRQRWPEVYLVALIHTHEMKRTILLLLFLPGILTRLSAQETITQYLSGTDKDHTVPWEFFCTKGLNSGVWTTIPVPSLWDQQGFGNGPAYGRADEQGLYRYSFPSLQEWQNKKVFIVFEGVLSQATVKINGKPATDGAQSGFYQFAYDISSLLRYDATNLLEVNVSNSALSTDHKEDFIGAGGIFAPVYLRIVPEVYISHVAIDARSNGNFTIQVHSQNTQPGQQIEVQIQDLNGKPVGSPLQVTASETAELKKQFSTIKTWNPENPNLYQAVISIKDDKQTYHTIKQRFGFRTSELKEGDGFYVNGSKVIFKGVNRRSAESGILLTREQHLADINLYKDMNMNAVRLSNYPPDPVFLDLCDSLGLFVINELNASTMANDTATGKKLVRDLVMRDVNHPAVVMWSNGQDNITNYKDSDYTRYDPQQRYIIRPAAKFGDLDAKKNADFSTVANSILYGTELFYPSEFSHGVYNGGHAAGLDDFWTEMLKQPKFSGGFLWSYHDEGAAGSGLDSSTHVKTDKGPSYHAIKEIWSPVVFDITHIPASFNGSLTVENRFLYTNLNKCEFKWKLLLYPKATEKRLTPVVQGEGTVQAPYVGPGEKGSIKLNLPSVNADALVITVYDNRGREINTWSWPIHRPADIVKTIPEVASISTIMTVEDESFMSIIVDGINYIFNKKNGNLSKVYCGKRDIPFIGPILAGVDLSLTEFKHYEKEKTHFIEAAYRGENWLWLKWTFQSGELPKLEYQYGMKGPVDYMGITFSYPEDKIVGLKWMGRGPFHVWRNRMKGLQLGVWEKTKTNANTPAGEAFNNSEVKGWHSDLYWVQFQTNMGSFTIYNEQPNLFLQFFKPQRALGLSEYANPPFPDSSIGFMHSISGIGTKAINPENSTSKSSLKSADEPLGGVLWIDFRH